MPFLRAVAIVVPTLLAAGVRAQEPQHTVTVRIELDQADAVIALLEQRARGVDPGEAVWRRLESTTGYIRLKRRQESFGAEAFDARFREFVRSDDALRRLPVLREALGKWRGIDIAAAAERALAYLPDDVVLDATIYPVIKRTPNSFVFELDTDPAIFMYVDPDRSAAVLANTLAHELHHVGSAACPDPTGADTLDAPARRVVSWLSGFGEGMAVLAAAGGPDVHPHASSPSDAWAVWERDVANFATDVPRIERFFRQILAGELAEVEQRTQLFSFINTEDVPQGAFYTAGWKMAALVERAQGREVVVRAVCDPRILLTAYNDVAHAHPRGDADPLPMWSEEFLRAVGVGQ
jgi:hypothetical protein